ncbi:hypothetical protein GCM10020218_086430 [Dactylosporangium vinaceum]
MTQPDTTASPTDPPSADSLAQNSARPGAPAADTRASETSAIDSTPSAPARRYNYWLGGKGQLRR